MPLPNTTSVPNYSSALPWHKAKIFPKSIQSNRTACYCSCKITAWGRARKDLPGEFYYPLKFEKHTESLLMTQGPQFYYYWRWLPHFFSLCSPSFTPLCSLEQYLSVMMDKFKWCVGWIQLYWESFCNFILSLHSRHQQSKMTQHLIHIHNIWCFSRVAWWCSG